MKLTATLLAASAQAIQMPTNNECYAANIDIDGNFARTNVVEVIKAVYSPQDCQAHCQKWKRRGCVAFVYQEAKSKCELFKDIKHIEYDEDSKVKVMGNVDGCLDCFRAGWDYVVDNSGANLQGASHVAAVPNVYACAKICSIVDGCEQVSYRKTNKKCFLKSAKAVQGIEYDGDYDSATSGCNNPSCVKENTEYANGWVTNYNIIGRAPSGYIPGVSTPASCQQICRQSDDCKFFSWQEGGYCYLVSTDYWLEYASDKVSGSRNCMQKSNLPK